MQHEYDTNDASATQVKNFNFDNYTSENIISHPFMLHKNWNLEWQKLYEKVIH